MRNTPLLQAVRGFLKQQHAPVSVRQIQDAMQQVNLKPNLTTLYRMLDKLVEQTEVEHLMIGSVAHYEVTDHHHHHFHCAQCDTVKCFDADPVEQQIRLLEQIMGQSGYQVQSHQFSLHGLCPQCRL